MRIPRTQSSYRRIRAISIHDPDGNEGAHEFADTVYEDDCPTHSLVLGPDGWPLEYEPKQEIGFVLPHREQ